MGAWQDVDSAASSRTAQYCFLAIGAFRTIECFSFFQVPAESCRTMSVLFFSYCTDASFRAVLTSLFMLLSVFSFLRFDFLILRYDTR